MSPIVQLIIQSLPALIADIQQRAAAANGPIPTPDEIMANLETAFDDSEAKDEMLKAALGGG